MPSCLFLGSSPSPGLTHAAAAEADVDLQANDCLSWSAKWDPFGRFGVSVTAASHQKRANGKRESAYGGRAPTTDVGSVVGATELVSQRHWELFHRGLLHQAPN